jgi:GMP synthase (glutamine-hydrolysing)
MPHYLAVTPDEVRAARIHVQAYETAGLDPDPYLLRVAQAQRRSGRDAVGVAPTRRPADEFRPDRSVRDPDGPAPEKSPTKPFLLLSLRAEDMAADAEYAAFLRCTGLNSNTLRRIRLEQTPLPHLDLGDWSGVLLGGGPFNSSDPLEIKSSVQRRVEADLDALLDEVVDRDFPFIGGGFGMGTLAAHQGGVIDRTYAEPISAVAVTLTTDGMNDPILAGVPEVFDAFVGHKEACRVLPPSAVLLATSPACPVQMFRVRSNLYATQFHPELDVPGLVTQVRAYQHAGYFASAELNELISSLVPAVVTQPGRMLANFTRIYAR